MWRPDRCFSLSELLARPHHQISMRSEVSFEIDYPFLLWLVTNLAGALRGEGVQDGV